MVVVLVSPSLSTSWWRCWCLSFSTWWGRCFPFPPGGGGVFPFPPGGGVVVGGVLGNNLPKIKLNPPLNTQPPIVFAKLPIVPIKPRAPALNIANIPPATANPVISSCFNFSSSFVFPSASARNSLSTLVVNHPPKRNSKTFFKSNSLF